MFCSNCGQEFEGGEKFCPECGTSAINIQSKEQGQREQIFEGKIKKCPQCGEILSSFESFCHTCGFELRSLEAVNSAQQLANKIAEIESGREKSFAVAVLKKRMGSRVMDSTDISIANIIRSHIIPNSKEDILEFMTLAASNIDVNSLFSRNTSLEQKSRKHLSEAWLAKFEQVYEKAKISFGSHPDFSKIEAIYKGVSNRIQRKRRARRKVIILVACTIIAVAAGIAIDSAVKVSRAKSEGKITPPISSKMVVEQDFEIVLKQFINAGFINVKVEEVGEPIHTSSGERDSVQQILIDSNSNFTTRDYYDPGVEVVIYYQPYQEMTKEEREKQTEEILEALQKMRNMAK